MIINSKKILESLNPQQIKAVQHKDGPLLIFAGAGSGKTRVITHRIAYLIAEHNVDPTHIIALTFTNKAAREMKERLASLLGTYSELLWVSTFHSACAKILRNNLNKCEMSVNRDFVIFDTIDQQNIIKKCVSELEEKGAFTQKELDMLNLNHNNIYYNISHSKQKKIHYNDDEKLNHSVGADRFPIIKKIYAAYQTKLIESNALDFEDLILTTIDMFLKYKPILESYQNRFRYILVDEYQDTNYIQYILLRMLTTLHKNLCVVGDDDQSIYSWRGANIKNIINFETDSPGTKIIKLEQNYRSTANILGVASKVIENNLSRKEKKLWTEQESGRPVILLIASDELDEARNIIDEIAKLHAEENIDYSEMAVLYRVNALSRQFEELLNQKKIPYKIFGGIKFYSRKEIKDVLSYIRLIINPADNISFLRIINIPKRGIGDTTVKKLEQIGSERNMSLFDVITNSDDLEEFPAGIRKKLEELSGSILKFKEKIDSMPEDEFVKELVEKIGYVKMLEDENTVEAQSRLENVYELINSIKQYFNENPENSFENFLEEVALINDYENEETLYNGQDYVSLMTFHNAKGLEFKAVFIVAMERNIFPHIKSLNDAEQMEEERRLCYVAITRAKERLYLSYANSRNWYGRFAISIPSVFLKEIPENMLIRKESIKTAFVSPELDYRNRWASSFSGSHKNIKEKMRRKEHTIPDESLFLDLDVGDKVRHTQLGIGVIIQMSGYGMDKIARVIFESGQQVDIMLRYGKLVKAR